MNNNRLWLYGLPWLRVIIFAVMNGMVWILSGLSFEEMAPFWPIIFVLGNLLTIFLYDLMLKRESSSYVKQMTAIFKEKLSLKRFVVIFLLMNMIGVGGMIGFSFLFFQGPPDYLIHQISWWAGILLILTFPITAGLSETPFYYGYALEKFTSKKKNFIGTLVYISIIYGIQHAFLPFLWDIKIILFRIISFIPLMILIGYLYRKNKSLKGIVITHTFMDLATVIQMLL